MARTEAEKIVSEPQHVRAKAPVVYVTLFDYDFGVSGDPSSTTEISTHEVPAGARVLGGWYEVTTTFSSAGADGATLALSLVGANDLITAILISDATNPWDVDLTKRRPLKGIATTLTAKKHIHIIRATQAVEAGVLKGAVEWILPASVSSGH